jgi:glutamate dehydrogenase (NADP+)
LTVDADVLEKLKFSRETIQVRLIIRMDDGSRKSLIIAWRHRYDDTEDPRRGESGFIRKLQRKWWRFSPFG